MSAVDIRLLGSFRVVPTDGPARCNLSPRAQACLAFLVLHPNRQFRRDVLAGLFWGDSPEDEGAGEPALHFVATAARSRAGGVARDAISRPARARSRSTARAHYDLDVTAFERGIEAAIERADQVLSDALLAHVQAGLDRYEGDLLEGMDDDWICPSASGCAAPTSMRSPARCTIYGCVAL